MARINTNVSSMIAQSNLSRTNGDLNVRLQTPFHRSAHQSWCGTIRLALIVFRTTSF